MKVINVPKFLYHATYERCLDSIKEHGLGGMVVQKAWEWSVDGAVCLAHDVDEAESYAENAEIIEDDESLLDEIVVLEIDTEKLNKHLFYVDSNILIEGDKLHGTDIPAPLEYRSEIPFSAVTKVIDRSR
jgi:hypothetical protein